MHSLVATQIQCGAAVRIYFDREFLDPHITLAEEDIEPEDGGIDIPQDTDGITRYPSQGGTPIPPDDVAKYDGQEVDDEEK